MTADQTFTITPREIRDGWIALMQGKRRPVAHDHVDEYGEHPDRTIKFAGMSGNEISKALAEGFFPDPDEDVIRASARGMSEVMVPQVFVNEDEGELMIGEVLAGEEEFLAVWSPMPEQRGARIRIDVAAHCGTSSTVIAEYYEWCLHLIAELQRRGNSPSVELVIRNRDLLWERGKERNHDAITDVLIPLVDEGEVIDPITWRAFMTQGAYRTLGFLAMGLVAEREGLVQSGVLGYPVGSEWAVVFDPDEGELDIISPNGYTEFPAEEMTAKLSAILERF